MKSSTKILITLLACAIAGIASVLLLNLSPLIVFAGVVSVGLMLKIFKDPKFGIFLITFLLPFERIGSFELMGTTIRASQIFALVTIFVWILIFLAKKINFDARNPLIIPIFFLNAFSVLSIINAVNIQRSVMIFMFNLFVMIVCIMIPNIVRSKETLNKVLLILFVTTAIVSVFGIYQFLGDMVGLPPEITGLRSHYTNEVFGFPRIQSTALEPLYFANYLLIPLAIGIAFILGKRKREEILPLSYFWIFSITSLAGINLILTLSRGGFLGFFVILLFASVIFIKSLLSFKKIFIIVTISLIAITSAFYALKFTGDDKNIDTFIDQATDFSGGSGVEERLTSYDKALELIKRHPIIGNGIGNFGPLVDRSPVNTPSSGWAIAQNEFLELWVEVGVLGLLSFIALIVIATVRTIKVAIISKDNYLKIVTFGMFIALMGITAQYQTFSILYILHIWFLIGLLIATQNLALEKQNN